MKKEEVELIILKLSTNEGDAINMKIYKNGTTCRSGTGGLPALRIGMMSFVEDARFFDPLIQFVPQEILDRPINREEEQTPNGYLEFVLAFYGDSQNGETGEHAAWAKSTGVRIKIDQRSEFKHPIMGLMDGLIMEAAELTNELYFDAVLMAEWQSKSSTLPEQTIISTPKTKEAIHKDYENYVNQMLQSTRKWDMTHYIKEKTYEKHGGLFKAEIKHSGNVFNLSFIPITSDGVAYQQPTDDHEPKKKKPWWKF